MKIKYRNTHLTLEQQVGLATDYNASMSIKDIEEKYKVARATIYNVLKKQIN